MIRKLVERKRCVEHVGRIQEVEPDKMKKGKGVKKTTFEKEEGENFMQT